MRRRKGRLVILVFGSINMDAIGLGRGDPAAGRDRAVARLPPHAVRRRGRADQAVAAARVSQGRVAMVARVGRDGFGEACRGNLKDNGHSSDHIIAGDDPTGCAFITVDAAGENAITVASGAQARGLAVKPAGCACECRDAPRDADGGAAGRQASPPRNG